MVVSDHLKELMIKARRMSDADDQVQSARVMCFANNVIVLARSGKRKKDGPKTEDEGQTFRFENLTLITLTSKLNPY